MRDGFGVTLIVSSLECQLRSVEVVVCKMISSQVVQIRDTLRGWEKSKWRRLLVDISKDLLGAA